MYCILVIKNHNKHLIINIGLADISVESGTEANEKMLW